MSLPAVSLLVVALAVILSQESATASPFSKKDLIVDECHEKFAKDKIGALTCFFNYGHKVKESIASSHCSLGL